MTDAQVVLVTGCSSGVGRATAVRLAAAGRTVYASARRVETIADLGEAGCRLLTVDVTDDESCRAAVRAIEAEHGAVDCLVNNAGYSQSGALETLPLDRVRAQLETNVIGVLRLCQLVLPAMRQQRSGRIVNVSSMGGRLTFPGGGAYHASKHAVEALSDALRFEVGGFGVHVVVIEPGIIRSGFAEAATSTIPPGGDGPYGVFDASVARATASVYERGLLARLGGTADDVARTIERALDAKRPRTRYSVTASARLMLTLHAVLPDRVWDRIVGGSYEQPR